MTSAGRLQHDLLLVAATVMIIDKVGENLRCKLVHILRRPLALICICVEQCVSSHIEDEHEKQRHVETDEGSNANNDERLLDIVIRVGICPTRNLIHAEEGEEAAQCSDGQDASDLSHS